MDDLNFTPDEENEFERMTAIHPKGFGQRLSLFFDSKANSITMFFVLLAYSIIGPLLFPKYLDRLLYYSNVYQLVALPLLGVATALSTFVILRFLYRIFLYLKEELKEIKEMHKENRKMQQELHELVKKVNQ